MEGVETREDWQRQADKLAEQLIENVQTGGYPERVDEWIEELLSQLDDDCIRVYLCNDEGIQLSSNYCREQGDKWRREEQFRGANWSWRPYFVPNLVQLNESRLATVSRAYTDLDSHASIRTVSVLVAPGLLFFEDLKVTVRGAQHL